MSMNNIVQEMATSKNYSENTMAAYLRDLQQFTDFLWERYEIDDIRQVAESAVEEFLSVLENSKYTPTSIVRKIAAVRSVYRFMVEKGYILENPANTLSLPSVKRKQGLALNEDEISRLLTLWQDNDSSTKQRDKLMFELMYFTGIKVGHLVDMDLPDVDVHTSVIRYGAKKERQIALPLATTKNISRYMDVIRPKLINGNGNNKEVALFVNQRGSRVTRQWVWHSLRTYAREAGIDTPISPQIMRYTRAMHLLKNGGSLEDVQVMLNHAKKITTSIYIKSHD